MANAKISALTSLTAPSVDDVLPIVDDPAGSPVTKKVTVQALLRGAVSQGTSFPGSPATNDRFFRTDRGMEYFYISPRWYSVTLYNEQFAGAMAVTPLAAGSVFYMAAPWAGVYDLWLVDAALSFYIAAGTALSASHKWVIAIVDDPGATTHATFTIDSGASNSWRKSTAVAIDALLGTTDFGLHAETVKTGTPGNIYCLPRITYRLVG